MFAKDWTKDDHVKLFKTNLRTKPVPAAKGKGAKKVKTETASPTSVIKKQDEDVV